MSDEQTFVIVGASLAGAKAAEQLRADGFTGRVVLIGEEIETPYERPPLSKGYLLGKEPLEKAFVHARAWYDEQKVELLLGVRVTALDVASRQVSLSTGEALGYDKLLLATGSVPRRLDLPGADFAGIHYLRRMTDSTALKAALKPGTQVAIIGAGWIGLEVAAAAREHGATVTVVERDRLPLRRVLGDEVATIYAELHRSHAVDFRFEAGVRAFGGMGEKLTHVLLEDDTQVPADVAVVGVGIQPAVELASAAGLVVGNGVVTDAGLRTSDPDVYAAGDVASYLHPLLGKRIRVEHWANARYGGRAAAKAMLGQDAVYDRVPYFYSDQYTSSPSMGMEYSGYVEPGGYDQVIYRGDPTIGPDRNPEFLAFWVKGDRVLAGMNVNVWDVQDDIQALVRVGYTGRGVDLDQLVNPGVPLAELVK
jgi:3-phenylpropionate/trans-cinnamate dioxygenase ferredoxin reductase subunit